MVALLDGIGDQGHVGLVKVRKAGVVEGVKFYHLSRARCLCNIPPLSRFGFFLPCFMSESSSNGSTGMGQHWATNPNGKNKRASAMAVDSNRMWGE